MSAVSFFNFHSTICVNENYRVKFKSNAKQKWKEKLNLKFLKAAELLVYKMFVSPIHSEAWFTSKVELVRNQGEVDRRTVHGLRILCMRCFADCQMSVNATGRVWLGISTYRISLIYTHSILPKIIPFTVFLPTYFLSLLSSTFDVIGICSAWEKSMKSNHRKKCIDNKWKKKMKTYFLTN